MRALLNIGDPSLNEPENEMAIVVRPDRFGLKVHEPAEFFNFTVQTFLPLTTTVPVPDARGFGATGVRIQARALTFVFLPFVNVFDVFASEIPLGYWACVNRVKELPACDIAFLMAMFAWYVIARPSAPEDCERIVVYLTKVPPPELCKVMIASALAEPRLDFVEYENGIALPGI